MSVRRALGGKLGAEVAVGAGFVFHHDLLAEDAR